MTRRNPQGGFSLIELMIAILLASITAVVVLTVLSNYQNRSAALVGRNDAQISAAVGLYALEREIRMAGAGLNLPSGPLCASGINIAYGGDTISDGGPLLPIRIIDGGSGPDSIEIIRSDSEFGAAPTRIVSAMASASAELSVDSRAGLEVGDLVLVGGPEGNKLCTLMGITGITANGAGWLLSHNAGTSAAGRYNPADYTAAFSPSVAYDVRDVVVNMGRYGIRRYGVLCTDGMLPGANNNCDLAWFNPLVDDSPGLVNATSVASQIIDLQAQYGISDAGNSIVTDWVDATGSDWANPSLINQTRIKAVRISIVARAERDAREVAPAALLLWDDEGEDNDAFRVLSEEERRFRYQVLTVVIPLINTIWSGV